MGKLEEQMIRKAIRRHTTIVPCDSRKSFDRSFTRASGRMVFWYNSADNSTHVVIAKIPPGRKTPPGKPSGGTKHQGRSAGRPVKRAATKNVHMEVRH
jgi:hypothetical protein